MMHSLILHPDCGDGPIHSVSAQISPCAGGCVAQFRLVGDVGRIKVPAAAAGERTDFLWKTTCFEIFWQPHRDTNYREFNLSTSSQWASYEFDDHRQGGRDAPVEAIAIASSQGDQTLELEACITADLPLPARVSLNVIVEDDAGTIQYWALAFADGKPDFHRSVCRTLELEKI